MKSGHGPQKGARYQDELVDWPSALPFYPEDGGNIFIRLTSMESHGIKSHTMKLLPRNINLFLCDIYPLWSSG
jgi:hypothetical protein